MEKQSNTKRKPTKEGQALLAKALAERAMPPPGLRTEYDAPLAEDSDEVVALGEAILYGAKLLRQRAHKLLDRAAWGDSGGHTEEDDENLFGEAERLNARADLLLAEYHRRVRQHWIAFRPPARRNGKAARQ